MFSPTYAPCLLNSKNSEAFSLLILSRVVRILRHFSLSYSAIDLLKISAIPTRASSKPSARTASGFASMSRSTISWNFSFQGVCFIIVRVSLFRQLVLPVYRANLLRRVGAADVSNYDILPAGLAAELPVFPVWAEDADVVLRLLNAAGV